MEVEIFSGILLRVLFDFEINCEFNNWYIIDMPTCLCHKSPSWLPYDIPAPLLLSLISGFSRCILGVFCLHLCWEFVTLRSLWLICLCLLFLCVCSQGSGPLSTPGPPGSSHKGLSSFSFLQHPVHQRSLQILQRCQNDQYSKAAVPQSSANS